MSVRSHAVETVDASSGLGIVGEGPRGGGLGAGRYWTAFEHSDFLPNGPSLAVPIQSAVSSISLTASGVVRIEGSMMLTYSSPTCMKTPQAYPMGR